MATHVLLHTKLDNGQVLLFAPTLGRSWVVSQNDDPGGDTIESETPLIHSPVHLDLTLVATYRCNLRCIYCYEDHADSGSLLLETARTIASDLIRRHETEVNKIVVGYFGGEPTLEMDFMETFTRWIRRECPDKRLFIAMTSNGVMSDDALRRIWNCVEKVKVSIDGPREIQDLHRAKRGGGSSFDRAFEVLSHLYRERPDAITIRSTVTDGSVRRLPIICSYFCEHFPAVRQQYEPVMDSCFADHQAATVDMHAFVDAYLEAYKVARRYGTIISTSFARFSRYHDTVNKFCGVSSLKYTIMPNGSLASCNRVHPSTVRLGPFFLAEPGEHRQVERPTFRLPQPCATCFARYNCKGGCYALRHALRLGPDDQFTFCDEIRRLVTGVLLMGHGGNHDESSDSRIASRC